MVAPLWVAGFLFAVVECLLGVLLNFYIIALNVSDWRRGLPLSLCDKILVLMAFNNICLQCDMNICTFFYIVFPQTVQYPNIYSTISVLLIFQFYFSFWITSALCIYYCLRIVSFKTRFFNHLKANIIKVVTRFLIGSAVGSLALSLLSIWEVNAKMYATGNVTSSTLTYTTNNAITRNIASSPFTDATNNALTRNITSSAFTDATNNALTRNITSSAFTDATNNAITRNITSSAFTDAITRNITSSAFTNATNNALTSNITSTFTNTTLTVMSSNVENLPSSLLIKMSEIYKYLTIFLGCCLPFLLAVLSIALTLTSLWTHTLRMKHNRSGFCIPSLNAHIRVARIMLLLLILYGIFYLSEVSLLASSLTLESTWELVTLFFVLIYPTAQSSIVILGNSKLCPTYLKSLCLGKRA